MDRSCVLFCVIYAAFLTVKGTYQNYQPQVVCAYSNIGSSLSCSGLDLRCGRNTHIEILNAVCGARKYFDNSCISHIFTFKCYSQTFCCRNDTGYLQWPMTVEHRNRLDLACSGKRQCHFKAPVYNLVNYFIHYCYVIYRCSDELIISPSTEAISISTSTKVSSISTSTTWKPDTSTSAVISVDPGIHGTKKRHVATHSTTIETAPGDSSSLPLSAIIVPLVLITVGMVLGIIFVRRKRQKRKKQEPVTKGTIDQHTTERASNQYETISPCTGQQSPSPKECERNSNQMCTKKDNVIAETYSTPSCHAEARFEETVHEDYHDIDLTQTKTVTIIGGPKETLNDANEDKVETNDSEAADHGYFILEAEDTYNEISSEDIEEYNDKDSTAETDYNRIKFSKRAFSVDPNYAELGVGKDWHKCDYSSLSDNTVQLSEQGDYSHITAKGNANDDHDDQYSHLKTSDTKLSDVENDSTYDHP